MSINRKLGDLANVLDDGTEGQWDEVNQSWSLIGWVLYASTNKVNNIIINWQKEYIHVNMYQGVKKCQ